VEVIAMADDTAQGHAIPAGLRVALVHDWLNGMRGGERVLEHFCALFPNADLFTLLLDRPRLSPAIARMNIVESPFARLPQARRRYRHYLPLMPAYIKRLPTADYDLVLSTSHCVAKAAPRPRRGLHLSYVFSPMRYVWDHFADYLGKNQLQNAGLRALRPIMQRWDRRSAARVDSFAADSSHIAAKIERFWGRSAETIHPAVELDRFVPDGAPPDDYFLVVSAFVPYKRIDRAIRAANLAKARLVVVGGGPEEGALRAIAGPTVEFAGRVPDADLPRYYQRARALLFPAIEDFGITALESMACGRPVLALRGGGVSETVLEGQTGAFFEDPDAKSLARLLRRHEDGTYRTARIRARAEEFSPEAFRRAILDWIEKESRFVW